MTKKLIRGALLDLLETESIENVSVTQLCKAADVSRSTFYLHYGNERDVIDDIENELVDGISEMLNDEAQSADLSLGEQVCLMCHYLEERRREAEAVFRTNTPQSAFAERLLRMRIESQPQRYKFLASCNKEQRKVILSFLTAGGFEALREWVLGESSASPEEIGKAIDLLTKH